MCVELPFKKAAAEPSCIPALPTYPIPNQGPPTGSMRFPYRFHQDWSVRGISVWQRQRWGCWKHRWEKSCAPKEVTLIECGFKILQILSKDLVAEENMLWPTVFLTQYEKQFQYTLPKTVQQAKICLSIEKRTTLPKAGAGRREQVRLRGSVGLPSIPGVSVSIGGKHQLQSAQCMPLVYWIFLRSRILRKVKYVKH